MRYNTELQNNNAELRSILDSVNALPDAESDGESNADILLSLISGISFVGAAFPFEELELTIPNFNGANGSISFQASSGLKKIKLITDQTDVSMSMGSMFATIAATTYNDELQVIDLSEFPVIMTGAVNMCAGNRELKEIIGSLNVSSVKIFSNMFRYCTHLRDVRFVSGTIKYNIGFAQSNLLSDESIQSIIDGLADLTGLETQTLTFHAGVKAKLTDEQITTITSKNWTLA